jgi:hypothetical protein
MQLMSVYMALLIAGFIAWTAWELGSRHRSAEWSMLR